MSNNFDGSYLQTVLAGEGGRQGVLNVLAKPPFMSADDHAQYGVIFSQFKYANIITYPQVLSKMTTLKIHIQTLQMTILLLF